MKAPKKIEKPPMVTQDHAINLPRPRNVSGKPKDPRAVQAQQAQQQ